ncbi:MAG: hypothetical protein ACLP7I_01080 [Limisphaerales bacterium]
METASAKIKPEFEAAHAEWLKIGGETFRDCHRPSVRPNFYRSHYWKLVKGAVLISVNFKCCRCNGHARQVHHLHYDFVGEDHFHPESLVAICRPCHGLVEHARNAEALISRISRRISLCKGFMEDRRGCLDQNAVHVTARLLEYRDELAELRQLFETQTFYSGFPIWFPAHDRRGLFFVILVIFVLLHSFASHFSSPPSDFCPALEVFRRHSWLQHPFSPGCEDTASVVAVVFI